MTVLRFPPGLSSALAQSALLPLRAGTSGVAFVRRPTPTHQSARAVKREKVMITLPKSSEFQLAGLARSASLCAVPTQPCSGEGSRYSVNPMCVPACVENVSLVNAERLRACVERLTVCDGEHDEEAPKQRFVRGCIVRDVAPQRPQHQRRVEHGENVACVCTVVSSRRVSRALDYSQLPS